MKASGLVATGIVAAPVARAIGVDEPESGQRMAEGFVFHDRNGNGRRDLGEPGVEGVCVSNGLEVVKTDRDGRWRLPMGDDTVFFVVKPSGWSVPVDSHNLPQFHYVHKPNGSPSFRYAGVAPTGPLPASIDFPLKPSKEDDKFRMVLFGDPQPRNQKEIDYIAHDVVEQVAREAAAVDAKFGLSLGDEMFDVLSLFESLNGAVGTVGVPWYNTVGNHDMNYDAADNAQSTETFQRLFGPHYYAFNYGRVTFVVLDNVVWHGAAQGGYHGEVPQKQLDWLKNYLALVPKDRLLVVAMHIPLTGVNNRADLLKLFEDRPRTLSLSAHTHVQAHYFLGSDMGWNGRMPHHHLNHATVCGSWWQGAPDERGIPHATMSDGAPNGYSIVEFDLDRYKVMFRAASRPESEQMAIWLPEECPPGQEVVVNVWAGSDRSVVEMRVDGGAWQKMENAPGLDPYFVELKKLESSPTPPLGLKLPNPSSTRHIWKSNLPSEMEKGTHAVQVKTTDMFGQVFTDSRIVRIV